MAKKLHFYMDTLTRVNLGVTGLSKAVKVTLGPKGRTVILYRGMGSHHVTKDGVTVAKDVEFDDCTADMAASLVKQVSSKTAELAGDGTTTATVLTEAIFSRGFKSLVKEYNFLGKTLYRRQTKVNPMDLKRGIDIAIDAVCKELEKVSHPLKDHIDVFNIATISANNDPVLGKLIADAYEKLGPEGVILTEESTNLEPISELNLIEGLRFDRGLMSPQFANNREKQLSEYDNPMYLLIPGKVSSFQTLVRAIELSLEKQRGLIIIAEDFDMSVIEMLAKNAFKISAKVVAIKSPGMGEQKYQQMLDIAALTGCKTLDPEIGSNLNKLTVEMMGSSKKISVTMTDTTIVADPLHTESTDKRIEGLLAELKTAGITPYHTDLINKRIAKLKGKLAMIKVGARTPGELLEKIDRLDDAIEATKSAIEEGYVAGSGLTLYRIGEKLESNISESLKSITNKDIKKGYMIVAKAIRDPFDQILINAGLNPTQIHNEITDYLDANTPTLGEVDYNINSIGFNSLTNEITDLIKSGVIDPKKVTRLALINAGSMSGLLLTSGCSIALN